MPSDKGIGAVDADGVALAGVKALIRRTAELGRENDVLRVALEDVFTRLAALECGQ